MAAGKQGPSHISGADLSLPALWLIGGVASEDSNSAELPAVITQTNHYL